MSDDAHLLIGRANGVTFRRNDKTEAYVSVPPAHIITDSDGGTWTLDLPFDRYQELRVLRNDVWVGEHAQRIEYRNGVVRLFGRQGWRHLSRNRRHII
jgi:hypothetical protein